jgi:hypothetical protein
MILHIRLRYRTYVPIIEGICNEQSSADLSAILAVANCALLAVTVDLVLDFPTKARRASVRNFFRVTLHTAFDDLIYEDE